MIFVKCNQDKWMRMLLPKVNQWPKGGGGEGGRGAGVSILAHLYPICSALQSSLGV